MTENQKIVTLPLAPGPRGKFLLGSIGDVQRDPIKLYTEARKSFGNVIRFKSVYPFVWHLVTHPDDIEYVLAANAGNYPKGPVMANQLGALVGRGLLTSDGDFWRRQRRLAQPAFHHQRLAGFAATMVEAAENLAKEWETKAGRPCDVAADMMRLTLRIVGLTLFSADIGAMSGDVSAALTVALEHINYKLTHPLSFSEKVPTPRNRRFLKAVHKLDEVVNGIIGDRRQTNTDAGDLLSMLMLARDEDGSAMDDRQLRDEVMTIVLAGHETTAVSLTWTWYLLARHPEVFDRLREELDRVLGGRTPTLADLPRLTYTKMVVEEAMRLYPPAWAIMRQAKRDDALGGFHIPARSIVVMSQYITHRHPDFWENPDSFNPDNFLPERVAQRPRYAYFPFGGGPRTCIGNAFAMMEAQLIVAVLAQRFRLKLVPGHPVELEPTVTLRPRRGMMMEIVGGKRGSASS